MNNLYPLALAAALGIATCSARAESVESAQALLDRALGEIRSHGVQTAAREFSRGGHWSPGSAVLMVSDFNGRIVVHSGNQRLNGSNMLQARDAAGHAFVQEAIALARAKGTGQLAVRWGHPVTHRIADGTLIVRRVPDQDLCIASLVFP